MIFILKEIGYFNSQVDIIVEQEKANLVNLTVDINLGEKAKIKKISLLEIKFLKIINLENYCKF